MAPGAAAARAARGFAGLARGRVVNATVTRGIPLLDAAALEAVRTWRYRPTLIGGVPVAVLMTVTVSFSLR